MPEVHVHDNSMYALANMLLSANRPGIVVTRHKIRDQLAQLPHFERIDLRLIPDTSEAGQATAEAMVAAGCDLLLCWETALSLKDHMRPGEILLPTRIVDVESQERYDTALINLGRRDRAALLSTPMAPDPSTRRRMAMKHQCLVIDRISAPLARTAERSGIPILVLCALIDTRADAWTNRLLHWVTRYGRRNPLTWIAALFYKPREIWTFRLSRHRANNALEQSIVQLKDCLQELVCEKPGKSAARKPNEEAERRG